MKALVKFAFLCAVVGAIALGYLVFAPMQPHLSSPQNTVLLKPGSSTRQIARKLESEGVIRSQYAFLLWHAVEGRRTLKAGEYQFEQSASTADVYAKLARGEVYAHQIVVPEGFNMFDIAHALESAGLCSRADFLKIAGGSTALVSDLDPHAPSLEGYLFPDTYSFNRTQTPHDIAAAMVKRFREEAISIGLLPHPGERVTRWVVDMHRTVTLASIVEKETSLAQERPLVAGVFENRMEHHIGLATDPSVIYASLLAGKFDGTIHQSDLRLDSPYNTYKYAGLPPGPIANPGKSALQAALAPTKTDYLYFVANNQGGHNFARTIEEHNHNVAQYRKGAAQSH
jgi:UPF0755 protein